jgi:hypothetical protein
MRRDWTFGIFFHSIMTLWILTDTWPLFCKSFYFNSCNRTYKKLILICWFFWKDQVYLRMFWPDWVCCSLEAGTFIGSRVRDLDGRRSRMDVELGCWALNRWFWFWVGSVWTCWEDTFCKSCCFIAGQSQENLRYFSINCLLLLIQFHCNQATNEGSTGLAFKFTCRDF